MANSIGKHINTIQVLITVSGFIFLAGVQVQSGRETRNKTEYCEERIRTVEISQFDKIEKLTESILRLEKAIVRLETKIEYMEKK